ncbi:ATP-binding protein [Spongiactinospora sp. TRM90649]|uniref:ATP-binding protein n=1 Tax=Spongiactinospora sp. TRM90649 TaxID=3031114 RepID=UPI0023F93CC3|nr:ATP-binding protein [Spongiactinospora sp. TRM90649]MDF5754721.1 ATP-binding protein [Spongiactinospora sp. TRM90649]
MSRQLQVTSLPVDGAVRAARAVVRDALRGLKEDDLRDAELVVAELAGNAVRHACPPYEVRVFSVGGRAVWCEVVDGDPGGVGAVLAALGRPRADPDLAAEDGRGLVVVRALSHGRCGVYAMAVPRPAKAVGFVVPCRALPSGPVRYAWLN